MVGFDGIADLLRRTRRRLALIHAATGASETAAVAGGTLLAAALLTAVASPYALRLATLGLAFSAFAWAAWRHGIRPRRALAGDDAVARLIERRSGVDGLLTAVQLHRDLGRPERARAMSAALARAAIARAGERTGGVTPTQVAPASSVNPPLLALLCVGLAWALAGAFAYTPLRAGLERLRAPAGQGDAGLAPASGVDEALAGDIRLEYRPPEYTGTPPRRVDGAWGEIQAIRGTVVIITARAFEPVASATLLVDPEGGGAADAPVRLPLAVEAGRTLSGQLVVERPGRWRLAVVRPGGDGAEERTGRRIEVVEDARPRVDLVAPETDIDVEDGATTPIVWRARDDFGVTDQALVWQLVGGAGEPRRVPLSDLGEPGGPDAYGEHPLALTDLGLGPGDAVSVYVEATDNNTVGGPRTGESETRVIRIRSPLDRHNELMARLRLAWDHMLIHLADRLEAAPEVRRPEDFAAIRKSVHALNDALAGVAATLGEILTALDQDSMARRDIRQGLRAIRDGLDRHLQSEDSALELASAASERGRLDAAGLSPLRRAGERAVEALEKGVLRLDDLFGKQALDDMKDLTRQLERSQERLRGLLERYKRAPDVATKRRIEEEIRKLQARIDDLLGRLAELLKRVPMEHVNAGALKKGAAWKAKDLRSRLQAVQDAVARGDVDAAMKALEELEKEVQDLATQLDEDADAEDGKEDTLRQELGAIEASLKDIRQGQDELAKETAAVDAAARDRRKEALDRRLQQFLEAELRKVEALEAAIRKMPKEVLDDRTAERQRRLGQHAQRLGEALERRELDTARDVAEEAHELAADLERDVGWRLPDALGPFLGRPATARQQQAGRSARDAVSLSKEIRDDLESLMPNGQDGYDEAERQAMQRLGGRQRSLERQARQLEERMRALEESMSMEASEMAGGLERAAGSMDQAGGELERRAPRPAGQRMGEALSELDALQEKLDEARQPGQKGRRPGPGHEGGDEEAADGRRSSRDKVDIVSDRPAAETLRREVLEAMKRRGPKAYEEQVKRYHRELIK